MTLELITTEQLKHMPKPEWLVEDFIAENTTTVIYGEWGLGKSFFVLDMILTATTGSDWYGGREIKRPLKTIYVVAEGVSWWGARVEAFELGRLPIDTDNILWIPEPVALYNDGSTPAGSKTPMQQLEEFVAEHRPDIVVFDTWVRCTGAFGMDENSSGDVATVIKQLDDMRKKYGVCPIIVHHPTKMGKLRGSGNLMASVERVIEIGTPKDGRRSWISVIDEKGNHTMPFKTFDLKFESVAIDIDHEGNAITSAILVEGTHDASMESSSGPTNKAKVLGWLEDNPGGHSQKAVSDGSGVKPGSIAAALNSLRMEGRVVKDEKLWSLV